MTKINYLVPDGSLVTLDAVDGSSVMESAVQEGIPGIVAECGGAGACATCHVYVAAGFAELVGEPSEMEDDLLDGTAAPRLPTSRLSCQITVSNEIDGLTVEIAPEQL